jgi:hypothetical protein
MKLGKIGFNEGNRYQLVSISEYSQIDVNIHKKPNYGSPFEYRAVIVYY